MKRGPLLVEDRYICSVLDEMRTCIKVLSFGHLAELIEQAQSYANRMEDGLHASKGAARKMHSVLTDEDSGLSDKDKLKKIEKLLRKRWDFGE